MLETMARPTSSYILDFVFYHMFCARVVFPCQLVTLFQTYVNMTSFRTFWQNTFYYKWGILNKIV